MNSTASLTALSLTICMEATGRKMCIRDRLNALNELLEHEQYISRQVNTFLILCWNVSMSFHSFISGLYADRIYVKMCIRDSL